jgi:hypothetical protein
MLNKAKISSRGRQRILVFSFAIITALGLMQAGLLPAFEVSPAQERKLKIAGMQHKLIMLLIENKEFDSIELEWKKVLDLKLGAEFEDAIGKSILTISYSLLDAKQVTPALKLLDESLVAVPFSDKSKADIFACKAALYKELKDLDSAIKAMRKAKELEEKP